MNLLFVCTGNSCRSPMAEAYCRMVFQQKNCSTCLCSSAGTSTISNLYASTQAQIVANNFGGDLSNFRSSRLSRDLIKNSDLIIAMTSAHLYCIKQLEPEANVKLLMDFAGLQNCNVPDPFGENVAGYQDCFEKMKFALDKLIQSILNN